MGEIRNADNTLVGKPVGEKPLGRPRRGWKDNIRMVLRKIGWEVVYWMNLAYRDQWRTCEQVIEPSRSIKGEECLG
jgi:hypothetical protein